MTILSLNLTDAMQLAQPRGWHVTEHEGGSFVLWFGAVVIRTNMPSRQYAENYMLKRAEDHLAEMEKAWLVADADRNYAVADVERIRAARSVASSGTTPTTGDSNA